MLLPRGPARQVPEVRGGRCEHCEGHGQIAIEMHFLPTVYVTCDVCKGKRFDRETLAVEYHGKNIYDILRMTVEEAVTFFEDIPWLHEKLTILEEVGLGYLELGQSATTLSGASVPQVATIRPEARMGELTHRLRYASRASQSTFPAFGSTLVTPQTLLVKMICGGPPSGW